MVRFRAVHGERGGNGGARDLLRHDLVRPRVDSRQGVHGRVLADAALQHARCPASPAPEAAVRVGAHRRGGRALADAARLRVRQGPVRGPDRRRAQGARDALGRHDRDRALRADREGRPDLLREDQLPGPGQGRAEGVPAAGAGAQGQGARGARPLERARPPGARAAAALWHRPRAARPLLRGRDPLDRGRRHRPRDRAHGRGARPGGSADRSAQLRGVRSAPVRGRVPQGRARGDRRQGGGRADRVGRAGREARADHRPGRRAQEEPGGARRRGRAAGTRAQGGPGEGPRSRAGQVGREVTARPRDPVGALSTAEVARILGLTPARILALVRAGLCRPTRGARGHAFRFQDVVVLRAAHELMGQRVPAARGRRALARLARELPEDRPVSGLRIFADGRDVAVRDRGTSWQPETGQVLLDFDVEELADKVAEIRDAPRARQERSAQARHQLDRAIELEDDDARAAARAYARALELDSDLVDAYVNLGRLAHEAGDPREALRLYTQALARDPDDALIHFNMAVALEDTQGTSPAVSHYQRALELDPSFADAHYNLAGLYEQLGRETDALRHYHAYRKLTGKA